MKLSPFAIEINDPKNCTSHLNLTRSMAVNWTHDEDQVKPDLTVKVIAAYATGLQPDDIRRQFQTTKDNVKAILEAAGIDHKTFGRGQAVNSMWEATEDKRRRAIWQKASAGAREALARAYAPPAKSKPKKRDVIALAPSPEPSLEQQATERASNPLFPHWKVILVQVAAKYGIKVHDLTSKRRNRSLVLARGEAFCRMRDETSMSLPQIGKRVGGRDHTTVLHGIKKHQARMAEQGAA